MSQRLHPPAVPGVPSLEDSYSWLTASLPSRLAETARALPKRLGLGTAAEGGWTDFVGLHPNRELPLYAAQEIDEDTGGLCLSPAELHRFVRAHHVGGFAWLLRDRLADGQVPADEQLMELARRYTEGWRDALAEATGDAGLDGGGDGRRDGPLAPGHRRRAERRQSRDAEPGRLRRHGSGQAGLGGHAVTGPAALVWRGYPLARLPGGARSLSAWACKPSTMSSIAKRTVPVEAPTFRRGSDARPVHCFGSPPNWWRAPPSGPRRAGFSWIGGWLETFAHAIVAWRIDGDAVRDEMEAIGLASELEAAVLAEDGLAVGRAMPASVGVDGAARSGLSVGRRRARRRRAAR